MRMLTISWSTSRGRDTYGDNICRLDDSITDKRYRCHGGNYDMIGTVFGEWLQDTQQKRLRALVNERSAYLEPYGQVGYRHVPALYGLTVAPDGSVTLDGACGIQSMVGLATACGIECQWIGNRRGHTVGYLISGEGV